MPPKKRGSAAHAPILLVFLLTSCSLVSSAVLEVGPGQLRLDSSDPVRELSISNGGPALSVLRWSATSDSPFLHVSPQRGEVPPGAVQTVRVSADFSSLESGSVVLGQLTLESNGGSATLPVSFTKGPEHACESPVGSEIAQADALAFPAASGFVPDELIVGYGGSGEFGTAGGGDIGLLAATVRARHGLELLSSNGPAGFERVRATDPLSAAQRLANDPLVAFVHPNYYVRTLRLPDDPCFAEQWSHQDFGLPEAWLLAGDAPVVLAVIDTGVDVDHEDLRGKTLPGYDIRDRDADPRPGSPLMASAHGTHVAGIALAQGNNGRGIAGVAYGGNVRLLPIKIFDDTGTEATVADLADAILWAAGLHVPGLPSNRHPADIVNMSVGAGADRVPVLEHAARRARAAGSLLVAAAGNNSSTDGSEGVQAPANAPGVVAVGSVDADMTRSRFSDWGLDAPTVDLMAPGGYAEVGCRRVRSTIPWSDYGCMAGTSMAAPFVAGVAALILSAEPDLDPAELERRLETTAWFDPATMTAMEYGAGVICAQRAVAGISGGNARPCGSP